MVATLLLDGCTARPQGPGLPDMAAEIHRFLDVGSQGTAIYLTRPQLSQIQSNPSIEATWARVRRSFVTPPLTPASALASATVGTPAGVPTLDAEANCRMAETLGAGQEADSCLSLENSARDQLVSRWVEFPSADRSLCVRYSTAGGGGTYSDLLTCLEMEMGVRNLHWKNQFVTRDQVDTAGRAGGVAPNAPAR
jgi:hypothetical protein